MPRFVILEHDHPFLHWDLMLESGDVLRTWRLHAKPQAGVVIPAESLGDHRKAYLDYEGPLSGNRGTVKRWDAGSFVWEVNEPDRVIVSLQGPRCAGKATLAQKAGKEWELTLTT